MHDLTKITSRKSTTKVITFYFRIPTYAEYLATTAESEVVAKLFYKPIVNVKIINAMENKSGTSRLAARTP